MSGPNTLTQAIYNASLPPALLALVVGAPSGPFQNIPYYMLTNTNWVNYSPASQAAGQSMLMAAQLAGLSIDTEIQLWGWSAPIIMQVRQNDGYAYVPPYGSANINVGPGLPPPIGQVSNYPATMPVGWIAVSTDAANYPPYIAANVPPPIPVAWAPVMNEMEQYTDPTTNITHYYYGIAVGQNPPINTQCAFGGFEFSAQFYPYSGPIGGPPKMWLLTGLATN
jgi:hypothetical protein